MKRLQYAAAALLILLILFGGAAMQPKSCRETVYSLDTVITLTAYGKNAKSGIRAAIDRIEEIDEKMSAYKAESDIGRINSALCGTPVAVSGETFSLLCRAQEFSRMTDGLFDFTLKPLADLWGIGTEHPRVPSQEEIDAALAKTGWESVHLSEDSQTVTLEKEGMGLDLGGIAKGYASEEAARVLKEHGVENACLDLGGNVVVIGKKPLGLFDSIRNGGKFLPFTVGIQEPGAARGQICRKLTMEEDGCVVTSGDYERYFEENGVRYHHIFDPRTGRPAAGGVRSATVIGTDATAADALSTVFFILGNDADGRWKEYYRDTFFVREKETVSAERK